jgi:hypothetical protein
VDDNRHEMAELWRYAHDPDLLEASVARWAYDRITGLEAALAAVTGWPLPTDPDPTGPQRTATQGPLRGSGDPDDDMTLCDPWCPAGAGGPHQHARGD